MDLKGTLNHTFKTLGPGLLFSGAAIGVSHLVMSTRAGASFGFCMFFFVVIANFFKYPFFQFGPRYAAITGKDLLDGYKQVGNTALLMFTVFTLVTFCIFLGAVTMVTSGLAIVLLDLDISVWFCSIIILVSSSSILSLGHYHYLVRIIKCIIIVLTISTILAFFFSLKTKYNTGFVFNPDFVAPELWSDTSISFLIALMGWMPAPIELSVWHSIWQLEKKKDDSTAGSLSGAMLDFNVGYFTTAIIALLFVGLGALMLYGTGVQFPSDAVGFSKLLIDLYTQSLGIWVWWVIAISAFTTMLSTTLTLLDAYARVISKALYLILQDKICPDSKLRILFKKGETSYNLWLLISILGTLFVLGCFMENMNSLTSFATILSFLTAPVFAGLNYWVITHDHVPVEFQISKALKNLSYAGFTFLTIVSVYYILIMTVL